MNTTQIIIPRTPLTPTMTKRTFSQSDVESMLFEHQYTANGSVRGGLAVIRCHDDGYCDVAGFTPFGLSLPVQTAWSGCLYPSIPMRADQAKLAAEARKLPPPPTEKRKAALTTAAA